VEWQTKLPLTALQEAITICVLLKKQFLQTALNVYHVLIAVARKIIDFINY